MKQLTKTLAILLVFAVVLGFSACENSNISENSADSAAPATAISITVVGKNGTGLTFSKETQKSALSEVLAEMASAKVKSGETEFAYVASTGDYGLFIESMLGEAQGDGYYWVFYSDILGEQTLEEYTKSYGDKTYYSASAGISTYTITSGETLLFLLITF